MRTGDLPMGLGDGLGKMVVAQNAAVNDAMRRFAAEQRRKAQQEQQRHDAIVNLSALGDANLASEFHKRIVAQVKEFDANLDQDHEVGMRLVTFGQAITFHVMHIGFHNPSLMIFHGVLDTGDPVELIQHVSEISFLLMKMARPDPSQAKKPFGLAAGRRNQ